MKTIKINWFNVITIFISIIALIFSYLSYDVSKQTLDYDINKDSAMNTPAISEIIDSTKITFKLTNNSELQSLSLIFPKSVFKDRINIISKPIKLHKETIENLVKMYLKTNLKVKDSTAIVGTFSIPVIMNYSVIVYGQSHTLRENRLLIFNIHYYDNVENVNYSNSFLISRSGYPLKQHYFFTGPFTEDLEVKVSKQDELDVQDLLETQLTGMNENFK